MIGVNSADLKNEPNVNSAKHLLLGSSGVIYYSLGPFIVRSK
jgi:hypothetical protein